MKNRGENSGFPIKSGNSL